jgi:hypothetical protein
MVWVNLREEGERLRNAGREKRKQVGEAAGFSRSHCI